MFNEPHFTESIFIFRQRYLHAHGQDMRLRTRLILVVETHRAVLAKVVSVPRFCWMAALNAVHSAACYHLALSIKNHISLFRCLMMMRGICASQSKIHQKEVNYNVSLIDRVALPGAWTDQEFVENRSGMTLDS